MKKQKLDVKMEFTKEHLRVMRTALEVYERLKMGQIGMAIDLLTDYSLPAADREKIEDTVKPITHPDLVIKNSYWGIFHPDLKDNATVAYEIQKVIEQYLAVTNNDGYWGNTKDYDEPIGHTNIPLPKVTNFKKYIEFPIDPKYTKKMDKLKEEGNFNKMWNLADEALAPMKVLHKLETGGSLFYRHGGMKIVRIGRKNPFWVVRVNKPQKESELLGG